MFNYTNTRLFRTFLRVVVGYVQHGLRSSTWAQAKRRHEGKLPLASQFRRSQLAVGAHNGFADAIWGCAAGDVAGGEGLGC